ncbi:type II secretion system major pseudopilin GspG [Agrilutibacter solisilvae]|uniref:Type II secretion system core protein G n=1 Tax=Agrilutibacter solisilvae TaxID=2763317 RepID=A0A974Y2A1_9GAMM|nr:type II secretion system major pseudopilin GspG [Lysobacter solisilvae]QSX79994.1 type II secretion system major pseudopilin GspG [Lysobacter solisilvae]
MKFKRSFKPVAARAAQRGFSLIEIIIVVVLIGGIVAFAASKIMGGKDSANVKLARSQVQTIAQKIEQFEMDTGRIPNTLEELVTAPGDASGWLGPYYKAGDLKDPWGTPFEYRTPGTNGPFDLKSLGADKKSGGTSVDADIVFE